MTELTADLTRAVKRMLPVHGFNNCARRTDYGELMPEFLALRPPAVRLHDTAYPYGAGHYVDVDNIFPDPGADPDDPASYDFTLTDLYIRPLFEAGIGIMYRLGCSIEHAPKKYRVFPPADPEKWASVCEHVVRHYCRGWADGFRDAVRYWEIWNEPDGLDPHIEPYGPPNWRGTAAEYYRLYSMTANRIKAACPDVLVGGYSSCYILGRFENGRWTEGDTSFFTGFLEYLRDPATAAPLDFFTWHGYLGNRGIEKIGREFAFVDETLNAYGFTDTLRIDAEWNCCVCDTQTPDFRTQYYINMRNEKGASHMAAALFEMQRRGVDMAMFYDAQLWKEYGPLFHVPSLRPTKALGAFALFSALYACGEECPSTQRGDVYVCAARGADIQRLGLANVGAAPEAVRLRLNGAWRGPLRARITDAARDGAALGTEGLVYEDGAAVLTLELPAYSVCGLEITKG